MPGTLVPIDSISHRVDAVVAVLMGIDRDGGLVQIAAPASVRPPRSRRVVAFMSASQIGPRVVEGALIPLRAVFERRSER